MTTIADRLTLAQCRIKLAAEKCARNKQEIHLLAVSKTKPISQVISAYEAGQRMFGENYVQEGVEKVTALKVQYPDIEWHFIGPLQSNKSKSIAEHFDWLHTLDREKIAKRLDSQRPQHMEPLNICIQVNISDEATKSGVQVTEVIPLAESISQYANLRLRGLMAIPTATDNSALQAEEFAKLQEIFETLKQRMPHIDTLSMGMSNDLEVAIQYGSTMVRIGSAIFGVREKPANST